MGLCIQLERCPRVPDRKHLSQVDRQKRLDGAVRLVLVDVATLV